MKLRAGILFVILVATNSTAAFADERSWEPLGFASQSLAVLHDHDDTFPWYTISSLRGGLRAYPSNAVFIEASVQANLLGGLAATAPTAGDSLYAGNNTAGLSLTIPRLYMELRKGPVKLLIGKAPYSQGASMIFNVSDVMNRFDALAYDDEKSAFWHIAGSANWGLGGELLLAVFPGKGRDDSRYLMRLSETRWEIDMAVYGGWMPPVAQQSQISAYVLELAASNPVAFALVPPANTEGQWFVGADFSRSLFSGISLRTDALFYLTGYYKERLRLSTGLDYQGAPDLSVVVEYLYDQTGHHDYNNYRLLRLADDSAIWTLAQHYIAVLASWQAAPLDSLRGNLIVNLDDASGTAFVDYTRSMAQDLDLRLALGYPWGKDTSEFGLPIRSMPSLSANIKWYF